MDEKTLPIHPFTGLAAIGFTSRGPVWPVVGGSQPVGEDDDEPDDTDQDAEGDDDNAEETEEPEVDWAAKAAELQAQLEASQANLTRARNQAKKLRQEREAAKTQPVKAAPVKATPARQQTQAPEPVVVQDDAEVERMQTVALRAYAKAALLGAGCDPELIDAPLSKLRAADIDWPEEEDEPFLDEWVDEMKSRYGKAFAPAAPPAASAAGVRTRRAASIDQAAGNGSGGGVRTAEKEISFGERLWQSGGGDVRAPRRPRR